MIKRILYFTIASAIVFAVSYFPHQLILNTKEIFLSFSLLSIYLFFVFSSILIYGITELISEKLPSQAGYVYLASIFLKIGLFVLLFQDSVFTKELSKPERFSLIIPLFLFLIIEAIAISKLLNSK